MADRLDMEALGADVVLTGYVIQASRCLLWYLAYSSVVGNPEICSCLSLKEALGNAERGQGNLQSRSLDRVE